MFIWQHVDIKQDLIDEIRDRCKRIEFPNRAFYQIINLGVSEFMGLELGPTALIHAQPFLNGSGIHIDARPDGQILALNIAIENCENSVTQFWKTDKPLTTYYLENGVIYETVSMKDCVQIDEGNLSKPMLFNTKVLHSVRNDSPKWRIALSLRFKEDPWHLVSVS